MNIFVLDTNPAIAASMHCDQHLHKMILESAQMLSTAADSFILAYAKASLYSPAYPNHPCTKWVEESKANAAWLVQLCYELEAIRESLGRPRHKSMQVVDTVNHWIQDWAAAHKQPTSFVFAGPDRIRLRPDLSITQKYQEYYKLKYREWLDTPKAMSYKGRPLPAFLSEFADRIPHAN